MNVLEIIPKKHKTFPVPIEKEIKKIDKDGNGYITTVSYKIKFIDSARIMESLLSNVVNNLAEGNHKIKCKDCNDNFIKYKCFSCNKNYSSKIYEKFKKRFNNTLNFLITILVNGVYLYGYLDDCEQINETSLLQEKNFTVT